MEIEQFPILELDAIEMIKKNFLKRNDGEAKKLIVALVDTHSNAERTRTLEVAWGKMCWSQGVMGYCSYCEEKDATLENCPIIAEIKKELEK